MKSTLEVLLGTVSAIREQLSAAVGQSERTIMLSTILIATAVSGAIGFILTQYFSVEVFSSLVRPPYDCWSTGMPVGRHCFNDYQSIAFGVALLNPWAPPYQLVYPAANLLPAMIFSVPAAWLHAPRLGMYGYLLALATAVVTPAFWAARGARGLEGVVVFIALGAMAVPAWVVIDRGNSVGFLAPIALVFLVALCRQQWGLVAIMVILASLVRPQFVVLAIALFAARQWRLGGIALGGVVISNLAAYVLWPHNFPGTIAQSIHNTLNYTGVDGATELQAMHNVSFGRSLLLIPDLVKMSQTDGILPGDFLAGPRSLIGYVVLVVVIVCLLTLGRRIPPVISGIALLSTAALFPALTYRYYLVFALPIAALVVRDPDGPPGSGIFDRPTALGDRRRAVGISVSLVAALTIAQIVLPGSPKQVIPGGPAQGTPVIATTTILTAFFWLVTCATILVSYARRPTPSGRRNQAPTPADPLNAAPSD